MSKQTRSKKQRGIQDSTLALRAADGTPFHAFPGAVVDNFRRMITGLFHREELPARISMVAALRQEGVTYTTLALATTLANDLAARVCAVELNWQWPGMQALLSPPGNKKKGSKQQSSRQASNTANVATSSSGLAAVLSGSATLDEALIQTELPNLALLPAGEMALAQRPYMARSEALKACIEDLNQRFDYVLLDIPSIQATSDAIALASLGTACCLVIQQGVTPVSKVRITLDEVKHLPMLGVVLNKIHVHTPKWIYDFLPQG